MDLHQRRLGDVEYLKNELLGHRAALSALVNWVNHQQMIPEDAYVPETEGGWLSATCRMAHWQIPSSFSLHPVNSQALLFHWRVPIVVLTHVSSETRQEFRDGGWNEPSEELPADLTIVDSVGFGEETVPDIQRPVQQDTGSLRLVAWDSHFHLDRTSQKLFGHHRASVQDVITAEVGVQPKQPVNVVGGVMVYCDPEAYPTQIPKEKGFGAAIGVHPTKACFFPNRKFDELRNLLRLPEVVALGEVGLDHTEPQSTWQAQEEILLKVLQLSMPIQPLIIHLRDPQDKHCGELSTRCLQILKTHVAPVQKIHLHCFGGTVEQVVSWLEAFPKTYFGFTESVSRFDDFQKAALRKVPRAHLLIETDSPYLKPALASVSTPAFIGDVATAVSRIRNETVQDILDLTAANTRVLYML